MHVFFFIPILHAEWLNSITAPVCCDRLRFFSVTFSFVNPPTRCPGKMAAEEQCSAPPRWRPISLTHVEYPAGKWITFLSRVFERRYIVMQCIVFCNHDALCFSVEWTSPLLVAKQWEIGNSACIGPQGMGLFGISSSRLLKEDCSTYGPNILVYFKSW